MSETHTSRAPSDGPVALPGRDGADVLVRRAGRTVLAVCAGAVLLLATHGGEFWPFSIFPMFSRAGRPFVRAVVRELGPTERYARGALTYDALPGRPFPLTPAGISQNDCANFMARSTLDAEHLLALTRLFGESARTHRLLVLAARGALVGDEVSVRYQAVAELSPDGAHPVTP